jgi:Putative Actinobacterial Holin-X, holin superfamily III
MASVNPPLGKDGGGAGNGSALEHESTGSLFRRLGEDFAALLRKEMALATSEVSRAITDIQTAIASVATGAAVLFAGFFVLLLAAAAALAQVMPAWLAGLIVGGAVVIIGFVMLSAGRKKLQSSTLKPERTQESVREDAEMLRRKMQ